MHIEKTTEIARSPSDVWRFIADARNDPQWCKKVESVEQVVGEGPGPAASYRILHRPRPGKPATQLRMEVVEFDEPRHLRWREEDDDGVFDVVYHLQPTAVGTRLTQTDDIDWKIPKLMFPLARLMVSRDISTQLASVKQILEAGLSE